MKNSTFIAAGAFVAALALPGYAVAQNAIATADVNMRAGPGTRFPVVTTIPTDRTVTLHGCEQNFNWCDVSFANNRGWVFADYLDVRWRDRQRPVAEVGPRIDLPIIGFAFGDYWGQHYRDRPWYEDRRRWEAVPDMHLADPRAAPGQPRADTTTWRDRREGMGDPRDERRWDVERDATLADPATGSVGPRAGSPTWQDRREGRGDERDERRWEVEPDSVLRQ